MLDDPVVQPAALVRSGDRPQEALQGLYVTDNDEEVWLASVATTDCAHSNLRPGSGRIFSVPRDEVVAKEVGPLQSVRDAAIRAPRLARELIATRVAPASEDKGESAENGEVQESATSAARGPATTRRGRASRKGGVDRGAPSQRALTVAPAIRYEPDIEVEPSTGSTSGEITIRTVGDSGSDFGSSPGTVTIGGAMAHIRSWDNHSIEVDVPPLARTGQVAVNCPASEGDTYAVEPKPRAVVVTRQERPRSTRYILDGRHSRPVDDTTSIDNYEWSIDGNTVGTGRTLRRRLELRASPYRVRLNITDTLGRNDSDELQVVRLPSDVLFCSSCRKISKRGRRVISDLRRLVWDARVVRIDGHTDNRGTGTYNRVLGQDRACAVRSALLRGIFGARPRVEARTFGERSPVASNATPRGRKLNRRVELLLDDSIGYITSRSRPTRTSCPT
jgi:outer membrane protein OmpA-like peptidoglycan-associated protein